LQWGGHCVVNHNPNMRISDATAVTFSIKCFNPLKLYPLSENMFRNWFASYFLFIPEHLVIIWSPTVNLIAVMTFLLTSGLHRCKRRIFKKNTDYFYAVRISISLQVAILSEIFIQIGSFLSHVSILTRNIDIANLSVCLSVCPLRSSTRWKRLNISS